MDMYQKREMRKNKKMDESTKSLPSTSINWYPGHMAKTKRQIIDDLKLIDVVIELLDARIPIASQNPDLKEIIGDKKKIILLNKCDLANDIENQKWVKYFEKNGQKVVLTDANSGKGIDNVIRKIQEVAKQEQEKMASKGRVGKAIRVMILGIPNVGKSSLINRLSKKTSTQVGNKPGVTRQKQWIRLSNGIELLDTPGVLWPKFGSEEVAFNLSFTGTIKDEILEKTEIAFYLLKYLLKEEKELLMERYKLTQEQVDIKDDVNLNEQIMNVFNMIGKKRGAIISGGNIDEEKVASILLDDFRSGKIGKISVEKVK